MSDKCNDAFDKWCNAQGWPSSGDPQARAMRLTWQACWSSRPSIEGLRDKISRAIYADFKETGKAGDLMTDTLDRAMSVIRSHFWEG